MHKSSTAPVDARDTLHVQAVNRRGRDCRGSAYWICEVEDHNSPVAGAFAYGATYGSAYSNLLNEITADLKTGALTWSGDAHGPKPLDQIRTVVLEVIETRGADSLALAGL